ncbi:MAG: hypothetical protein K2Z81_08015, partial [Cyanobacteria bacterium]|nr:hypothetical protein [Cyanobacteriota bacterium]
RLRVPRLRTDKTCESRLQLLLESLDHVEKVRVNVNAACVIVDYTTAESAQVELIKTTLIQFEDELRRAGKIACTDGTSVHNDPRTESAVRR